MHIWEQYSYHYPLAPYKNRTGAYIDSDEDNIPDIVESLLSNNSTFAKFARLFADPTSEYYNKSLWKNYSWCIAYFYSVALNESFYDINESIADSPISAIMSYEAQLKNADKKRLENATEWLRNEFNPLIMESMAPVVVYFHAETDTGFGYAYSRITVDIRDPSGIDTVILMTKLEKNLPLFYDIRVFDVNGNKIFTVNNLALNITAVAAATYYFAACNATDLVNNSGEWDIKVRSLLWQLLEAFWDLLVKIGKKLAEAVNFIVEWIKGLIENSIGTLLGILISTIVNYQETTANVFYIAYQEFSNKGSISKENITKINSVMRSSFVIGLWSLGTGLYVLLLILTGITFGLSTLLSFAITFIITMIIQNLFHISDMQGYSRIGVSPNVSLSTLMILAKSTAESTNTSPSLENPDV